MQTRSTYEGPRGASGYDATFAPPRQELVSGERKRKALVVVEEGGEAYKPVQPLGVLSSFCFPECQYPIKPNPVWLTYEEDYIGERRSLDESSLRGSVCVTLLPVIPRNIGMFEAVRYLPKQLLRRITSAFSTTSTVHLAFIDRPSLSWLTDSSSSSARRYLSW
ncbi:unnamed protein product [Arabidopsis thaliana]|uniref:Uncharacterized protein n=2 Tax=Arabidopsis thaliana TaxID=3702 RepID=A0A654FBT4_ARATH|nr:uncharacterized protein AT3G28635 [Arabidopsis thaliana]ANM65353.1 hypothetical protein AT3G28635 [Arabidopsis thaliana]CAA0384011.1 unnamed protein product [Arabidopsis thaliana]VYS58924.1 unnamed protein product [Arabidopsis thaliana]|eukprot:NP_001327331.1 hypothetical protein AT3G28635 [Arabidopsis thaliana]